MIIKDESQLTEAVLAETERTEDPRLKEILQSLVRHLHGFAREVRLTEKEFDQAINLVTALGHRTTESHNETRLIAGSLGLSTLVCLMNNGDGGRRETSANLLGPFWRSGAPRMQNGASIVRSPTAGRPLFFTGRIVDLQANPIQGAEIDVWHASPEGLYENQDPNQAEWNLRGKFTSDQAGVFSYRSIKPAGYPVPMGGPAGALLRAQKRHPFRPAHLHSLIYKPGFKTMASQIYSPDDPLLETDAQFGVTRTLIGRYVLHENEPAPDPNVHEPWYSLEHVFVLEPGEAWLPTSPVTAKTATALSEAEYAR
ncbi:MAG TPA: dioxygenase [Steroidobacteraceae bacterium]|nr:dioxygenase [Steroidobacteraceae bacterium]